MSAHDYDIHLDVKHPLGTVIDVGAEAAANEPWFNQTLAQVDEAVVRLGVLDGDFHWHKHDDQDELFLVLEGSLAIAPSGRGRRRRRSASQNPRAPRTPPPTGSGA